LKVLREFVTCRFFGRGLFHVKPSEMAGKQVGRRRPASQFEDRAKFLETLIGLRGDKPFIPRGIYRFKTHEEAQAWSLQVMTRTRKKKAGRQA
jgi:hypothetical protein